MAHHFGWQKVQTKRSTAQVNVTAFAVSNAYPITLNKVLMYTF